MKQLRERLKKFHNEEGVNYKNIAKSLEISPQIIYNFTSELRDLKPYVAEILNDYLKERGY